MIRASILMRLSALHSASASAVWLCLVFIADDDHGDYESRAGHRGRRQGAGSKPRLAAPSVKGRHPKPFTEADDIKSLERSLFVLYQIPPNYGKRIWRLDRQSNSQRRLRPAIDLGPVLCATFGRIRDDDTGRVYCTTSHPRIIP
jgi:hypothetical protein